MTTHAWILLSLYLTVILLCAKPLGIYMATVMEGRSRLAQRLETPLLRLCGVRASQEMTWKQYAFAILLISLIGTLAVYALQRLQFWLPLNPQQMANVSPDSSFNTAVSFVTNTNWQGYGGETTMSYLTQMLALAVQNFLSAATGIAVVFALIRGIARHSAQTVGNAWADLFRATVFILLPISFVLALVLVSHGVIQNFSPYVVIDSGQQTLAMGGRTRGSAAAPDTHRIPAADASARQCRQGADTPATAARCLGAITD